MGDLFAEVAARAKAEDRAYLMEHECKAVLEGLGISTTGSQVARSEEEAVRMAEAIGYPVVLKIVSPEVVHKSDAGGVKLDLKGAEEVRQAFIEIREAFGEKKIVGVAVQRMAPPGTEAIVGVARDPTFGPILMFGLGGIFVEILRDVSLRSIPITEADAEDMIRGIKGRALLEGYRGRSADILALKRLLMQISDLVVKHPAIAEMDLNPVILYPDGYAVVDARIILGEALEEADAAPPKVQDLHDLFYPKSIAVIGASGTRGKLGWNVFCNLINHDFKGELYPINPRAESILGIKAYPRISAVGKPIDVAVILVQASMTPEVVKECCDCGVKYVIVESAGFAEMGDSGRRIEEEMKAITDSYGVRLLGPNCSGIINTHCSMVQSMGIVDALSREQHRPHIPGRGLRRRDALGAAAHHGLRDRGDDRK